MDQAAEEHTESFSTTKMAMLRDSGRIVTYDPNLLRSGYARKLYVVTDANSLWRTDAHMHPTAQISSLIDGDVRLAYPGMDGAIKIVVLEPGRYYHLASNVPHQLEIRGRLVAETFTAVADSMEWLVSGGKKNRKTVLPVDLFELAARGERFESPPAGQK